MPRASAVKSVGLVGSSALGMLLVSTAASYTRTGKALCIACSLHGACIPKWWDLLWTSIITGDFNEWDDYIALPRLAVGRTTLYVHELHSISSRASAKWATGCLFPNRRRVGLLARGTPSAFLQQATSILAADLRSCLDWTLHLVSFKSFIQPKRDK